MWRSRGLELIKRGISSPAKRRQQQHLGLTRAVLFSVDASSGNNNNNNKKGDDDGSGGERGGVSLSEAKKLLRLVNVEALKRKLCMDGNEVIRYSELIKACQSLGVSRSTDDAAAFAKVLDEAGVILMFRDKVYLHPGKVVDSVRKAVPLALSPEDDPRRDELGMLQKKKKEIDMVAHKQVRRILGAGLGFSLAQIGVFFRLTFWDFSWDIMEPVAFFITSSGLVIGYSYFLFTSKDPTYQDLRKRLFVLRQRKLYKKMNFDIDRFLELQCQCNSPLDSVVMSKGRRNFVDLELEEDGVHTDRPSGV